MSETGIVALATQLASADPAACDQAALTALVAVAQRARCWLDALDVRIAIHAAHLAEHGHGDAARVLAGGGRRTTRDAAAAARRGGVCESLGAARPAPAADPAPDPAQGPASAAEPAPTTARASGPPPPPAAHIVCANGAED